MDLFRLPDRWLFGRDIVETYASKASILAQIASLQIGVWIIKITGPIPQWVSSLQNELDGKRMKWISSEGKGPATK